MPASQGWWIRCRAARTRMIAGFGVFQLQAADIAGWWGYMSQEARAYALAVFLQHRNLGSDAVAPHLYGRCRKYLKRGMADLARCS